MNHTFTSAANLIKSKHIPSLLVPALSLALYLFPILALAHGEAHQPGVEADYSFLNINNWFFDPSLIPLMLIFYFYFAGVYRSSADFRRKKWLQISFFVLGTGFMILGLCSPIDKYADVSFFMHMLQHLLIIQGGALFMILGHPFIFVTKGFPSSFRKSFYIPAAKNNLLRIVLKFVLNPFVAGGIYLANIWMWHYPPVYQAAYDYELMHYLQHFTFFFTALMMWWSLFPITSNSVRRSSLQIVLLLMVMLFENVLGAIITFISTVIYDLRDVELWGLTALQQQQLGGLLMWIGGNTVYFVILLAMIFRIYSDTQNEERLVAETAGTKNLVY